MSILSKNFLQILQKNQINFYCGVPDSLFSSFSLYLEKKYKQKHFVCCNEGSAIGLGIGYYLAKRKIPLVYLQNSGLGNIINPLVSLADPKVYSIPIFLLIGWRGELKKNKQIKDEPQHVTQGRITIETLKLLKIKYKILGENSNIKQTISSLKKYAFKNKKPVALVVRSNIFEKNLKGTSIKKNFSREEALKIVIKNLPKNSIKISTTGMLSRELYELNLKLNSLSSTFMCTGGMGHAISLASGIALNKKKKKIICLDGDGSFLMHLGASAFSSKIKNIVHIVFNNRSHDSVGGNLTSSPEINISSVARVFGYKNSIRVFNEDGLKKALKIINSKNNLFIEICCEKGSRNNLLRPKEKFIQLKKKFINHLNK